ncbi:MAG TPA: SRPBCC family protein [Gemmataceae bacterium]|jgi:uncharacterized membrane protein|nr:SRPBCC family protein [Gemmataceae bacterium]
MSRIAPYFSETENAGRVPTITATGRRVGGQSTSPGMGRPGRQDRGLVSRARRGEFPAPSVNVGDGERALSALGGSALALYGLTRGTFGGLALAAVGGAFLYRGLSGHCDCYAALCVSTADDRGRRTSVPAGSGCRVDQTITINRPASELYSYWRTLSNLPKFMRHLESVTETGNRSHWVAKAPLGMTVSWDAEVITERPNELIGWRSLPGSMVDTAGSVHFQPTADGRATEVRVELKYDPPAGKVGATLAKWLGESPKQKIEEDLTNFKRMMEAGKV